MKLKSTLKAIATALAPIPNRGFRAALAAARPLLAAALSLLMAGLCPANAGEPCHWDRLPNKPAPFQFDTYHGESIDFRCTFVGFSSLPFGQSSNPPIPQSSNSPRLYYQTNGMAAAWWDIPATVSTTVVTNCQPPITNYSLSATFPPSADPGAERLTVFFGAPSNAYAAAQVRFRNSPGATPNVINPPSVLDWLSQLTSATNALAVSLSSQMSQSATNYTDLATNALLKSLAPTITTNDVCNIVTNEVPITSIVSVVQFDYTVDPQIATNIPTSTIISIGYVKNGPPIWTEFGEEDLTNYWKVVWKITPDSATLTGYDNIHGDDSNVIEASTASALDNGVIVTLDRSTRNALGLARLTDLATATNDLHKSFAPTITNIAPTRAEVEAGWWSEWEYSEVEGNITIDDILVVYFPPRYDPEGGGRWAAGVTTTEGNMGFYSSDYSDDDERVRLSGGEFGVLGSFTATRHRVAAPVPTKISDLKNDVGYVSASTATNIALAVSADATNSLSTSFAPTITNIASSVATSAIASADTTYRRTIGLTNLNQSVQYVNITDPSPTTLAIQLPDGVGESSSQPTADWIVYITAVTNVALQLPPVTWWMADSSATNEIPPATPTALWFSQVTDGIFILGRQELTEVMAP